MKESFEAFRVNQRHSMIFCSFLVVGMMVCFTIAFEQVGQRINPDWHGGYLPWLGGLVAIESMYSQHNARKRKGQERWIYYLSEWILIAIVLKFLLYGINNPGQILVDLPRWEEDFTTFFEGEYLVVLVLVFLVWGISSLELSDLNNLQVREDELYVDRPDLIASDREGTRQQMAERVMIFGAVMVVLTFLARMSLEGLFGDRTPVDASLVNVVIYFILALTLLSQTQFAVQRGQWLWKRTPISPQLARNWALYSLVFLAILALVAVVLPTRYTLGLLDTLSIVFNILSQIFMLLFFLITLPIIWLINWLGSLFGKPGTRENIATLPPPEFVQSPPKRIVTWWELVQSILFWLFFLAVLGFFIGYYFRQNRQIWAMVRKWPVVGWLVGVLDAIWSWFAGVNRKAVTLIQSARERLLPRRLAASTRRMIERINFRQLTPRQQVIYFYLRLVERGARHGFTRAPSQTPYQYEQVMAKSLPEVDQDLVGMAESFVEARYSLHTITTEKVGLVQAFWRRITEALRKKTSRG